MTEKKKKGKKVQFALCNTAHFSPVFYNLVSSVSTYIQSHLKTSYLWCEREVLQPQTSYRCPPASPITIKTAKSTLNQIMLSNCFHISLSDNGCLLFSSGYSRYGIHCLKRQHAKYSSCGRGFNYCRLGLDSYQWPGVKETSAHCRYTLSVLATVKESRMDLMSTSVSKESVHIIYQDS